MYSPKPSESAVQELDGELLEGSGFEAEVPASGFETDQRSTEEGSGQ
jgi:hypothetical protein